ncbi:MAG: hypothetical protein WKG00_03320 [Polyangiaceae bacterium]
MIRWSFGTCLLSVIDDGVRSYQPDYYGEGESGGAPCESVMPFGLLGRPRDPDVSADGTQPEKGAGLMYFVQGGQGFSYPTADPRDLEKIPPEKKGSAGQYSSAGSFHLLDGDTGSYQVYVPYTRNGTPSAMGVHVNVDTPGEETIHLAHGAGMTVLLDGKDDSILVMSKNGKNWIKVNDDAVEIVGNLKVAGGVLMGDATAARPVALAPELATWAAAVVIACGTAPGGPITIPPLPATFIAVKTSGA